MIWEIMEMNEKKAKQVVKNLGTAEILCVAWVGLALAMLIPAKSYLQGSFPIFTVVWLFIPLLAVIRTRDASRVGFYRIAWREFLVTSAINLGSLLLVSAIVEPWSHAYQELVEEAMASASPDTTFAWLVRFDGMRAWSGLFLYSGLVTIFAEELFFRGWLLQLLQRRMKTVWAIVIQAALFTLPQLLAVLLLSPLQGMIYAVAYSWLGVGMIGGWAAARTQSIWPSLASATIWNAILIAWVL